LPKRPAAITPLYPLDSINPERGGGHYIPATAKFLELAERLAWPAGLTAAWWQVLGAVLQTSLPVAGIAREMGITPAKRPADRRSPDQGLAAIEPIGPAQAKVAKRSADELGMDEFRRTERLPNTLDAIAGRRATLSRENAREGGTQYGCSDGVRPGQ
jgi:hypothetical protein